MVNDKKILWIIGIIIIGILLMKYSGLFSISGTTECYQETANVSTACGGVATGTYSFDTHYFYINYTKPSQSVSGIWQVKHGDETNETYNITIPNDCFSYSTNTLILRFYSRNMPSIEIQSYGQCYNGSWNNISGIYNYPSGACSSGGINRGALYDGNWNTGSSWLDWEIPQDFYLMNVYGPICYSTIFEEAMIWQIQAQDNQTNQTQTVYRNVTVYVNQTVNQSVEVIKEIQIKPTFYEKYGLTLLILVIVGVILLFLYKKGKLKLK